MSFACGEPPPGESRGLELGAPKVWGPDGVPVCGKRDRNKVYHVYCIMCVCMYLMDHVYPYVTDRDVTSRLVVSFDVGCVSTDRARCPLKHTFFTTLYTYVVFLHTKL